jgi:hypothetical protein
MATETPARASGGPRRWLLALLGLAVVALIVSQMFLGDLAAPTVPTTTTEPSAKPQSPQPKRNGTKVDPSELDVKLEALRQPPTATGASERNPFRFKPPPPPPPPPPKQVPTTPVVPVDPGPPPPPPITIKFIGVLETARGKVGAFIDCGDPSGRNRATFAGREGEVVEGRYRVVRIGIESAVVEYQDGRGRTTLPLNGQAQACLQK